MNHVTNSKVEPPDIETAPTEDPHPGPGAVHLLPADGSLDALRREGTYMALCGALLPADKLPPGECPPGCDADCWLYCAKCVRRAAEQVGLVVVESAGAAR